MVCGLKNRGSEGKPGTFDRDFKGRGEDGERRCARRL
jgi:hypothetical protein